MARRIPESVFPRAEEVRISIAARIRSVPFVALLLLGVQAAGFTSAAPGWVRFIVAVGSLIWAPGFVLTKLLRPQLDGPFLRLSLPVFLGAAAGAVFAWVGALAGMRFSSFVIMFEVLVAVLLMVGIVWTGTGERRPVPWGTLALVAALVLFASLRSPGLGLETDAPDHIGYLRHIISENALMPDGVLAHPEGVEALPPDPRKGMLHPVFAAVAVTSQLEPLDVWMMLPVVLFPAAFLAFLAFTEVFVAGSWQLVACAVLFALSYGGIGFDFVETVAYGQNLAVAWYWLLVPILLVAARRGGVPIFALCALLVLGGALAHIGVVLHAGIVVVTLYLFAPWFDLQRPRVGRLLAVVLVTASFAFIWKAYVSAGTTNEIHMHPQGLLYLVDGLFVMSPVEILRRNGMLFLGGLVSVVVLAACARRNEQAKRIIAVATIPFVMSFIPFVSVPLFRFASYMVFRSILCVPAFAAVVTMFALLVARARRGGVFLRTATAIGLAVWSLVFFAPTIRAVTATPVPGASKDFVREHMDLIAYVRGLPRDSVILSDPRTSYGLSAVSDHRFVAVYGQHANPRDPYALERLAAVRDVLNPYALPQRAAEVCDRYNVGFVIINGADNTHADEFLSEWDRGFAPRTRHKLIGTRGRFRNVYEGDGITVLLHAPSGTAEWAGGDITPPYALDGPAGVAVDVVAPHDAFQVTAVSVFPGAVLPGEAVNVTLCYEKMDRSPLMLPVEMHLRFDNASLLSATHYPGEKFVRRNRERRTGKLLRYRVDHVPFEGTFPVAYWPIGKRFYETFAVTLPSSMALGTYQVEISVQERTLLPNFTLSDFFYNRDHYSGTSAGTVQLTDRVER